MKGHIKPGAFAILFIKGVEASHGGQQLVSRIIYKALDIDVSVLMGANIAGEDAKEEFCETTIGARSVENGLYLIIQAI